MSLLTLLFGKPQQATPVHKEAGAFNGPGLIVSVPGGTTGFPGKTTLVTKALAMGAAAVLQQWSAKVIDQTGSDQIYFQICRNGFPISGYERVPGVQFESQSIIDIGENVRPGEISIVAFNISGMNTSIEPSAIDTAVPIKCQAWWKGTLLSERGGL